MSSAVAPGMMLDRAIALRAAYSSPRVIHKSEESPQELLPAASVNNSAAEKFSECILMPFSPKMENTHRPVTNYAARRHNAYTQSFEPGDALVLNEYSVADRFYKQVSL